MGLISDFSQLAFDLVEREIRDARQKAIRIVTLVIIGLGMLFMGLALLIWGIFIVLVGSLGTIAASFIAGGAATIIAVILLMYSRRLAG